MYIQITTKCNMNCVHCGFACTRDGEDMSMDVFKQAIKFVEKNGEEAISIGGGEPTIHPNFWEIIGLSLGHIDYVWLATNGSQTDISLNLARLAQKGIIGCALSLDPWHAPISQKVIEAFVKDNTDFHEDDDGREIRNVSKKVEKLSPFRNPLDGGYDENCICPSFFIRTNGDIHFCGCKDSQKIGDVFNGIDKYYLDMETDICWKEIKEEEECA